MAVRNGIKRELWKTHFSGERSRGSELLRVGRVVGKGSGEEDLDLIFVQLEI